MSESYKVSYMFGVQKVKSRREPTGYPGMEKYENKYFDTEIEAWEYLKTRTLKEIDEGKKGVKSAQKTLDKAHRDYAKTLDKLNSFSSL